jgi:hypothetical protein
VRYLAYLEDKTGILLQQYTAQSRGIRRQLNFARDAYKLTNGLALSNRHLKNDISTRPFARKNNKSSADSAKNKVSKTHTRNPCLFLRGAGYSDLGEIQPGLSWGSETVIGQTADLFL